jgi:endonuclease-8
MSETLWATGVSPWLPVGEATDDEILDALQWARTAMRAAVGGVRPDRSVYRRAGRPCTRCGTVLRSRGQGDDNRTAYWCPGCQRGPTVAS